MLDVYVSYSEAVVYCKSFMCIWWLMHDSRSPGP